MKKVLLILGVTLSLTACTDADMSKLGGYGSKFKVEMINCDGSVSREWISSGKILSEVNSDGYYFTDNKTKKLIEVTGRIIITKQ